MDTEQHQTAQPNQTRRAALGGLAVVGFIALILIGIGTAIYAASFLPKAFSRLAGANVYLSSLDASNTQDQNQATNPNVVVTSTTTSSSVPLSPATPSAPAATTPAPTATPTYTKPAPVYTPPTYTQPTYAQPVVPTLYGLPDLTVSITSVGYLTRSGDTSSFVAASSVPQGYQGAVRFTVANRGTNVSGGWNFRAELPSDVSGTYYSAVERSLNPGDSIIFTLGFDSTRRSTGTVRIIVDPNDTVNESNGGNNTDTASIYLNGNGTNYTSGNGSSYDSNGNYCSYGTYYSNGRTYCQTSYTNSGTGSYDSNGSYCSYGTYVQNGRTYCQTSNGNNYTGGGNYDSNGTYCPYGTYVTANRYYCQSSSIANGNSTNYDSNGSYCTYGTYYQNNRYYCNTSSSSGSSYDSSGNYCAFGTYASNGRMYCSDAYTRSTNSYDSNGNYCSYGTSYSNGRYYCS